MRSFSSIFVVPLLVVSSQLVAAQPAFNTPPSNGDVSSLSRTEAPKGGRWQTLVGTDHGLYGLDSGGDAVPLWTDGGVRKILRAGTEFLTLGDRGVVASADLVSWETRNQGLPVKVLKRYDGTNKTFDRVIQELKDLEADPADPAKLATATKDAVFLSRDGGRQWTKLGFPGRTNGLKAVAVVSLPETIVFAVHPIYGVSYYEADKKGAKWIDLNAGLAKLETTDNPDEVSDIVASRDPTTGEIRIWAAQTFKANVYRLDWAAKRFVRVWTDGREVGTVDSLDPLPGAVRFVGDGGVAELRGPADSSLSVEARPDLDALVSRAGRVAGAPIQCLYSEANGSAKSAGPVQLSELWLVPSSVPRPEADRRTLARGKQGLYLPVNHAADQRMLTPYLDTISRKSLDMVVVDMKDDVGRLRFAPKNPAIAAKGRVFNPVDLDTFVPKMKSRGIWLVARIVVFKDPELAKWKGGAYAVWDAAGNKPWQGTYTVRKKKEAAAAADGAVSAAPPASAAEAEWETSTAYYDERWVDPYSEEVWDYTAAIGAELVARGFDEIQFDYIRFPTDGENLGNARYRWRDQGMDMESAIMSFLSHVRSRISAPISLDIYGANGWYRTGARTGQEVELLSHYVDVICPMYYPSHFEQNFLADAPAEQRPYRIYYRGTLRTERIARGRIVVRPYVQSFYLNVSYDRKYYGPEYVLRQVIGVRDAGSPGLTYWNNVGRYDEIPHPGTLVSAPGSDSKKLD
jgi:hypothetical protein